MKVLAGRSGDAEGLLHQTVRLVSVALRLAVLLVFVATAARVGSLAGTTSAAAKAATALALHLAVCQEAARNSAGTPRLSIGPSPHAGFPLVPNED